MADIKELRAIFDKVRAEKAELDKVVNALREKRDAVLAKCVPFEQEAKELALEIRKHIPAMTALDEQISALARLFGGKRMSEGTK